MRGDQASRLLRFAMIFSGRPGGVCVSELAGKAGVSVRTVYRDLMALQEAGYPLYSEDAGGERRWRLSEGFRATLAVPFSTDELVALHIAREAMPGLAGAPFAADLNAAFDKIAMSLQGHRAAELERRRAAITVDPGPVRTGSPEAVVEVVQAAADACETISMVYKSPSRKKATKRRVDPYRLHNVNGSVYLLAYCHLRGELRAFLVDRIKLAAGTGRHFVRQRDQEAADWYRDAFSSFQGPARPVTLLFEPEAVPYVRERRWHPSQVLEDAEDGAVRMHLDVHPGPDLEAWIRSWGRLVEVIEPDGLRRRVANELMAASARYGRSRREKRPAPSQAGERRARKRPAAHQRSRKRHGQRGPDEPSGGSRRR